MKSQEIAYKLAEEHHSFVRFITSLDEQQFSYSAKGKWTAGQQLDHIYRSIKPLSLAMALPKVVLRLLFGKANRPSRTYDGLVVKYRGKLAEGGKASGRYLPRKVFWVEKDGLGKATLRTVKTLTSILARYTEEELDTLILPHPLLGKLTLREMMYFTIYHVGHHHEIARRSLSM